MAEQTQSLHCRYRLKVWAGMCFASVGSHAGNDDVLEDSVLILEEELTMFIREVQLWESHI